MRWLLATLVLAGCEMAPPSPLMSCGAAGLEGLVGQPLAVLPDGNWGTLRLIHPGDAVTEDFSASRLNVYLDGGGIVRNLACG